MSSITVKLLLIPLFFLTISLVASDTYYQHRVSQFELLSRQTNKNITMIGDSITDRGLWSELTNRNDIINRGISGDTTNGVLNRLNSLNSGLKQAFVMIGINDLLKGESVEYVFENYKKIITILKQKNITPIIQSTLYIGQNTPPIYNQKITQLNILLLNYAIQNKITFIDLNKYLAPNNYISPKYSNDSLHLNGRGYVIWTNSIKKYFNTTVILKK